MTVAGSRRMVLFAALGALACLCAPPATAAEKSPKASKSPAVEAKSPKEEDESDAPTEKAEKKETPATEDKLDNKNEKEGAAKKDAPATDTDAQDPAVDSGRKALKDGADFPWYDADRDGVKRIDVKKAEAEERPDKKSSRSFNWLTELAWIGIAIALGVLAYVLIKTFLNHRPEAATPDVEDQIGTEIDRVEHLPMPVRRPVGDLLSEARRHYQEGNYREAIIYLYSHELVTLDKQQAIRLARGKTNRQYLRELRGQRPLCELLEQTMYVFEDAFFGDLAITRQQFESCWNRLPDFDALVQRSLA